MTENEQNLVDIIQNRILKEGPIAILQGEDKANFEKYYNKFKQITGLFNWPAREEIYKLVILWFIAWTKDNLNHSIRIEKELCNPQNGELVGPYYHVIANNEIIKTFTDIQEAAKFAEHKLDWNALEIAFKENPNCFKSVIKS